MNKYFFRFLRFFSILAFLIIMEIIAKEHVVKKGEKKKAIKREILYISSSIPT